MIDYWYLISVVTARQCFLKFYEYFLDFTRLLKLLISAQFSGIYCLIWFLQNVDILKDQEAVKQLASILKTNVRACKALGHPYVMQLGRIYLDMLNVYKVMSENISAAIAVNGEMVMKQPLIKSMRVVKKETLKLISDWVSRSNDHQMVNLIHWIKL